MTIKRREGEAEEGKALLSKGDSPKAAALLFVLRFILV